MRRRSAERGSALILAILVLFAMLGLGLLAMRTTTQNISGSGNLRLTKQARYVAEAGMYRVASMMANHRSTLPLMTLWWEQQQIGPTVMTINDRGQSRVQRIGPNGDPAAPAILGPQFGGGELLSTGPEPLGQFGEGSGLVASYEVRIEGLRPWAAAAGNQQATGQGTNCMMHFTARGYVSRSPVGEDDFEAGRDDPRFAEHTIKAALPVLLHDAGTRCQDLYQP
ncbi:MAG: pilus assembly PilX N-terminal domain-containing protein [Myxococcales bacterium]|nr:pilus assembly PilX N-terminal domain-containing protein [Myxococcales bacterium]